MADQKATQPVTVNRFPDFREIWGFCLENSGPRKRYCVLRRSAA